MRKEQRYPMTVELRKALEDLGKWDEFYEKRRLYAKEWHCFARNCNDPIIEEMFPEGIPGYEPEGDFGTSGPDKRLTAGTSSSGILAPSEKTMTKADFQGKPRCSMREAVEWVFENLKVADVVPEDAPSPGAFALLLWTRQAKANQGYFYQSVCCKAVAQSQHAGIRGKTRG